MSHNAGSTEDGLTVDEISDTYNAVVLNQAVETVASEGDFELKAVTERANKNDADDEPDWLSACAAPVVAVEHKTTAAVANVEVKPKAKARPDNKKP